MLRVAVIAGLAGALLVACGDRRSQEAPTVLDLDHEQDGTATIGVSALDFECTSVATIQQLSGALGTDVKRTDAPFEPPAGVPRACHYLAAGEQPSQWSFDLDCRESAIDDGSKLMAHYAKTSDSNPVNVGQSGLDHSGASLLFIDDNTPCYGRVLGPTPEGRLAVARIVADGLTPKTAPTGYRYGSEAD